jgi:hypothetical protein
MGAVGDEIAGVEGTSVRAVASGRYRRGMGHQPSEKRHGARPCRQASGHPRFVEKRIQTASHNFQPPA